MHSINANTGMRVTVWDKAGNGILRTEIIDITTSNTEVIKTITTLNLVKTKNTLFTFNNND